MWQEAHTGAVWSVVGLPDESGFISGSADQSVKFWCVRQVRKERRVQLRRSLDHLLNSLDDL